MLSSVTGAHSVPAVLPTPAAPEYLLEIVNVTKRFPGVVALSDVQLRVRPGTVLALMGENGAGKSTLMKIIAGIHQPDAGELRLRGQAVRLETPLQALQMGIAMIHQELNLMPQMSIAENIWLGREPLNGLRMVDHGRMYRQTRELFGRLRIDLDPKMAVGELSIAGRQMVEIAKAVSYDSDVLIMDEPTSAITEKEVAHLFSIIADLKAQGKGIIYITHKMDEVFAIADEVAVFRDGTYVGLQSADSMDGVIAGYRHLTGPAPMMPPLSARSTRGAAGLTQPISQAVSVMYFSIEPMVTVPWPDCSITQFPSHKRSCGQMRPQISGKVLVAWLT